jgi:colanic acid/amylovoran biosynthesis protein
MKIILDNGAYTLRNMGDVAMLQAAVKRMRASVSEPELFILTTSPELLKRYCPGTIPLTVKSRDCLFESDRPTGSTLNESWRRIRRHRRSVPSEAREFQRALDEADAVLLCGGGFLNDINPYQTRPVLRMLVDAARRGKRTGLFSQGLGPLEDPELLGLLRRTGKAGVPFALRESLYGPEILSRAGVRPSQVVITGDDAVEMAWAHGPASGGNALGFSMRRVSYSEVEPRHVEVAGRAIAELRKRLAVRTVPLPVSFNTHEQDSAVVALVTGADAAPLAMDTPEMLIAAASECRVVVTGTYHAAVFALAQGIPCVCFYVSTYYRNKLEGLAKQFPGGCAVVNLNADGAAKRIVNGVLRFWETSDAALGSRLRQSAEEQIQSAQSFYGRVMGRETGLLQPEATLNKCEQSIRSVPGPLRDSELSREGGS